MKRVSLREHTPSVLIAALSSAFGVVLLQVTGALATVIRADSVTGSSGTVGVLLALVAVVFIVIALYVGAIVTANTFATIIAGRTRVIALLRLIGSSAATQRRAVAREGIVVGVVGALIGAVVGTVAVFIALAIVVQREFLPPLGYTVVQPVIALPIVAVILTTWLASWVGSRRVLIVTPMQATSAAVDASLVEAGGTRARNVVAIVFVVVGLGLLVLGIAVGLSNPIGVLIGVAGGVLSFTGVVLAAHLVMPPALRIVGAACGRSPSARLAAENAVRYPERSSRTTIGLVIGVTLVTMFAVAASSFQALLDASRAAEPEVYFGIDAMILVTAITVSALLGFSAFIAAVGVVNNLSLSVLQRTREIGLLRALGFSVRQVRAMIVVESAQLTIASVLVGLVLGTFYGWAGAQSLLGSINGSPGIVLPSVPIVLIVGVVIASAVLTLVASLAPARRATRVAPVVALAIE